MNGRISLLILSLTVLVNVTACAGLNRERLVYDERGIQIGIQPDPSISRTSPPAFNTHPARLTANELQQLLEVVRVSGYSGTLAGIVAHPQPIPLFSEGELRLIATPLAVAFNLAGPRERVFFSLSNVQAPYEKDRTTGALFLRGPYLHLVLTDHTAFTRADTGGGEDERDLLDTKGMKLYVAGPAKAASPSPGESPSWEPFEKVFLSLNVKEVLAAGETPARLPTAKAQPAPAVSAKPSPDPSQDLRLQIRELTEANQELRAKLKEQAQEMASLKEALARVLQDLDKAKTKAPSRRKAPIQ